MSESNPLMMIANALIQRRQGQQPQQSQIGRLFSGDFGGFVQNTPAVRAGRAFLEFLRGGPGGRATPLGAYGPTLGGGNYSGPVAGVDIPSFGSDVTTDWGAIIEAANRGSQSGGGTGGSSRGAAQILGAPMGGPSGGLGRFTAGWQSGGANMRNNPWQTSGTGMDRILNLRKVK